eukprot:jgi/Galph1/1353/GphlegSOOS_G5979.1
MNWKQLTKFCFGYVILVRLCIALFPYSGQATPPLYGDLEAQRHWMEITLALPIRDWYRQTVDNDLEYWGIDYPPLSAYYSWICGKFIQLFDPSIVQLHISRGIETVTCKCLLRMSVIFSDIIFLLPSCWHLCKKLTRGRYEQTLWLFVLVTLEPCLVLIDHGHFQYNGVSMCLIIWSIVALIEDRLAIACVCYLCAIHFKQICLYYSLAFASFFFARLRVHYRPLLKLLSCISVTVLCLIFIWWPWLNSWNDIYDVLRRIFPFSRGLYEDKVANLWCSLSPIVKVQRYLKFHSMVFLCIMLTVGNCVPFIWKNWKHAVPSTLILSFVGTSLSFYLFSFQVHEKHIILPVLMAQFLALEHPYFSSLLSFTGLLSMFPLLNREHLDIAYLACCLQKCWLLTIIPADKRERTKCNVIGTFIYVCIYLGLHLILLFGKPPMRYPHLFILFITNSCCGYFLLTLFYCVVLVSKQEKVTLKTS